MAAFIVTQPQWNETSEDMSNDHLQNGALTYVNSPLTPDANSNFRLLNRTPTNQTGEQAYNLDNSKGGFELLLANDVDNSNPVVQAEQLNWLYYLMNFGTITANDADANFDGIRVDAVDNVDADLLQIAADYFKLATVLIKMMLLLISIFQFWKIGVTMILCMYRSRKQSLNYG